jgi:hypothetical protein
MVGKCQAANLEKWAHAEVETELRAIQDEIDGQEQFEFGRAEHREEMRKQAKEDNVKQKPTLLLQ